MFTLGCAVIACSSSL